MKSCIKVKKVHETKGAWLFKAKIFGKEKQAWFPKSIVQYSNGYLTASVSIFQQKGWS